MPLPWQLQKGERRLIGQKILFRPVCLINSTLVARTWPSAVHGVCAGFSRLVRSQPALPWHGHGHSSSRRSCTANIFNLLELKHYKTVVDQSLNLVLVCFVCICCWPQGLRCPDTSICPPGTWTGHYPGTGSLFTHVKAALPHVITADWVIFVSRQHFKTQSEYNWSLLRICEASQL